MRAIRRGAVVALVAVVALAAAAGAASATRLSFSRRGIRAVWTDLTFTHGGLETICRMTVEGSFHANTLLKARFGLYGHISRAITNNPNCTGYGQARAERLPWHIKYHSFTGRLPNIGTIFLNWVARIIIEGYPVAEPCTYSGELEMGTVVSTGELGPATGRTLPRTMESSGLCPETLELSRTTSITELGSAINGISITLI
jgi:hypothetical protein